MKKYDFWDEHKSIIEDFPDEEIAWEFLENEPKVFGLTPYDFLHGCCDVFAAILHEKYGYMLEYVECFGLVHAYCIKEIAGHTYYIDVRGISPDYDAFLEDFKDFIIPNNLSITRLDFIPERYIHLDNMCNEKRAATSIIDEYNYYGPDKIQYLHNTRITF